MFSKTNVTLETCTQEFARAFSQMPALKGERSLRPARLAFLRAHLKDGTFVSPTWAVVVDATTNVRYRANGQHSSTVLAEASADAYPKDLLVTVEEYTSDDLERDAVLIFELFDNPAAARSNGDVMHVYQERYDDLHAVDTKLVLMLASGLALYEKGKGGLFLQTRQRGAYLAREDFRQFILWASPFGKAVHGWLLKKPGVVAEMLAHRTVDEATAHTFWQLVFTESHPDADHETRELSRTLKEWAAKPKVTQDRFRKETAKQWRRFRRLHADTPIEDEVTVPAPARAARRTRNQALLQQLHAGPEADTAAP